MVYQVAKKMQLAGSVNNSGNGVHIFFNATEASAHTFYETIKLNAPSRATITSSVLEKSVFIRFTDFNIVLEEARSEKKYSYHPI